MKLDRLGYAGDQRHAAATAGSGLVRADVRIHGAHVDDADCWIRRCRLGCTRCLRSRHRLRTVALGRAGAHGLASTPTWNREISRIVYEKCASCHHPDGGSFSLIGYLDAQPRANEIKDAVLSRRMPPWGAVKGFGSFRNDQSLTEEQIELVRRWVDGGIRRGNNPQMLPPTSEFAAAEPFRPPDGAMRVSGPSTIRERVVVEALFPERIAADSLRIVAQLPDGRVEPLVWLHGYDERYAHPFVLRRPIELPAGTRVQGLPADAVLALIRLAR